MDDFFRIPRRLCYLMVKKGESGKSIEASKRIEVVENDAKRAEESSSARQPISVINVASAAKKEVTRSSPRRKKRREKVVNNVVASSVEDESREKILESGREDCSKNKIVDHDETPLNIRERDSRRSKSHKKSHGKREIVTYECEICSLKFSKKREYTIHMVNHSTVRSHKCDVCGKAFKRKSELKSHVQLHSGVKYNCDECDFVTTSKVAVRYHVRRVHQRDFRYKCEQCEKSFMSNCELKDHRTSHSSTKSFICEICGKAYLQKSYLGAHKRTVHGVILKVLTKDHRCDICNKSFVSEYILQNHVGIHSRKFLCPQCGKEFANNQSLTMHNRMHTGERPYPCKICSKSFVRSNALAVHELTHSGKRPYVCDLCGKSFTQRSTMMGHRKKHPGVHPPPPPTLLSKLDYSNDSNS